MKPARFDYHRPDSLEEALELRSTLSDDSVVLAGGQSLVPLLSMRLAMPSAVIDLGRIDGLAGIRSENGHLAIGAMTRQRQVEQSELVREQCPLLPKALAHVAHPTVRNRGTIGGSIAHADGAAELPVVAIALDVELVARSVRGERVIAAKDFFLGVFTTALEPDELLVEIRFPTALRHAGSAFVEMARRDGDFALVGVAALVALADDASIASSRLVFMGVGSVPVRAVEAEGMLAGAVPEASVLADAARYAAERLEPASDIHATSSYRSRVAAALGGRALAAAVADARQTREADR